MQKFKNFLDESKNVGILYHFTNIKNAHDLLSGKKTLDVNINPMEFISKTGYLSCTRNFCLSKDYYNSPDITTSRGYIVRIVIDGNKVSNNFKVQPIKGLDNNSDDIFNKDATRVNGDESEEVISNRGSKIFDLSNCIIQVDVLDEPYSYYTPKDIHDAFILLKNSTTKYKVNLVKKFKPYKG